MSAGLARVVPALHGPAFHHHGLDGPEALGGRRLARPPHGLEHGPALIGRQGELGQGHRGVAHELTEPAEQKLAEAVRTLETQVGPLFKAGDYAQALKRLAGLRPAVDEFFDKVMVMVDEADVRNNRLALLNRLSRLFLNVADISRLQS